MKVQIDDPELDQMLKELATATGESVQSSVVIAVRERLDRVTRRKGHMLLESIRAIQERVAAMPNLDPRTADEIIGYDESGVFDSGR